MSDLLNSLSKRLSMFANSLDEKAKAVNNERKKENKIEQEIIGDIRYKTKSLSTPNDIVCFNDKIVVGLNVDFKNINIDIDDILPIYDNKGIQEDNNFLNNKDFISKIKSLMSYNPDTYLFKITVVDNNLYVIFNTSKTRINLKTFQWTNTAGVVTYGGEAVNKKLDNGNFIQWNAIPADSFNTGILPNKPINDMVFLSIAGGEISFARVNDTKVDRSIFKEKIVSNQVVSDTKAYLADYEGFIAIKVDLIDEDSRFYIFNKLSGSINRADGIRNSLVVIGDGDGCVFSNGYLLTKSDEFKIFNVADNYDYQKTIVSPNGEDVMYVFFSKETQDYTIYPYNIVEKEVHQYINASGFTVLDDGTMYISKYQKTPSQIHNLQKMRTPFLSAENFYNLENNRTGDGLFAKVNNSSIVEFLSNVFNIINISRISDNNKNKFMSVTQLISDVKHKSGWTKNYPELNLINDDLDVVNSISLNFIQEIERHGIKKIEDVSRVADATSAVQKFLVINNPELIKDIEGVALVVSGIDKEINSIGELESSVEDKALVDEVNALKTRLFKAKEDAGRRLVEIVANKESFNQFYDIIVEIKSDLEAASSVSVIKSIKDRVDSLSNSIGLINDELAVLDIDDIGDFESIQSSLTGVYSEINMIKGDIERKYNNIFVEENGNRFESSVDLLNQYLSNELSRVSNLTDLEDAHIKVNGRIDSLENQFSGFEEYSFRLSEIRVSLENSVESKRELIINENNKLIIQLEKSFTLNLNSIRGRINKLESVDKLNEFFASDTFVNRAIETAKKIADMGDTVKSESLISKITSLKDSSFRDVRDRQDLYTDGGTFIKLGRNKFPVNRDPFRVNIIHQEDGLYASLSSTDFRRKLTGDVEQYADIYDMTVSSENDDVSRAEYLAYNLIEKFGFNYSNINDLIDQGLLLGEIREILSSNIDGGYSVGVHDIDAESIVKSIIVPLSTNIGETMVNNKSYISLFETLISLGGDISIDNIRELKNVNDFCKKINNYDPLIEIMGAKSKHNVKGLSHFEIFNGDFKAFSLLIDAYDSDENTVLSISSETNDMADKIIEFSGLGKHKENLGSSYNGDFSSLFRGIRTSIRLSVDSLGLIVNQDDIYMAVLVKLFSQSNLRMYYFDFEIVESKQNVVVSDLRSRHDKIENGVLNINLENFLSNCKNIKDSVSLRFNELRDIKSKHIREYEKSLSIDSFVAKPISSFIRNRLITNSYLDIIGNNLAKQIGSSGANGSSDQMGLLMLISPPGYGKTTLVEYIASKMGMVFVKINCPSIGYDVKSLDPSEAKDLTSRREIEKINNSFEMGNNVMLYLDDIQHTNPELLQKFISLCDATRTVDGVIDGEQRTFDLKGKKFSIVMSGNPYTESGEVFKVPDMLANRADVYNLGDMLSDQKDLFDMSYIENSLTANDLTRPVAFRDLNDLYEMVDYILERKPNLSGVKFNYNQSDLSNITDMVKSMMEIKKVVSKVNQEYILSSTIGDEFRKEPAFKLQGSYRNMNKMVSKLFIGITKKELDDLIMDHYNSESQTLTNAAEENILKFKSIYGNITDDEKIRLEEIREQFIDSRKNENEELIKIAEAIKSLRDR